MAPEFPIRIIFDDGECVDVDSPDELVAQVDTLDSDDPRVWVRDVNDRSVRLKMRAGIVQTIELAEP